MALVNPYCSVAQVRDYIRNQNATTSSIEDAINAASRWIDDYKGRDFYQHDHTSTALVIDGFSGLIHAETLFLPFFPIVTLTEVVEDGTTLVAGTDYKRHISLPALVRIGADWAEGETDDESVKLTGKFGYAQAAMTDVPTGIPAYITQACVQIAAAISKWNLKDIVALDGTKQSIYETDIPKSAKDLLGSRAKVLI